MPEQDEYIQEDMAVSQAWLPLYGKQVPLEEALALKMELAEEWSFQQKAEKQQNAILLVKSLLENTLEHRYELKDKMLKSSDPLDVFIKTHYSGESLLKKTAQQKSYIRQELIDKDYSHILNNEIHWIQNILRKIDKNDIYLIEILYLDIDHFREVNEKGNKHNKLLKENVKKARIMLEIISPFLTEESISFFESSKTFGKTDCCENSSDNSEEYTKFFFLKNVILKSGNAYELLLRTQKKLKDFINLPNLKDWEADIVSDICTALPPIGTQVSDKFFKTLHSETEIGAMPFLKGMREEFSSIYQHLKKLEALSEFINTLTPVDDLALEHPNSPKVKSLKEEDTHTEKQAIDIVPKLDESFLFDLKLNNPSIESKEAIEFANRKKLQLKLWKSCIEQRKAQMFTMQKIMQDSALAPLATTPLSIDQAKKIVTIYNNIKNKPLFESFFKNSKEYKPHNASFEEVEQLIQQMGGTLQRRSGSHYAIKLFNTYSDENYPITMGGSYEPHGTEKWTKSAHDLCEKAFVKAGMTLERIEQAQEMLNNLKKRGLKNA